MSQFLFQFGNGTAETDGSRRDLLGGKGASLVEMSRLGIPVPPGFSITTEVCTYYYKNNRAYPPSLEARVREAVRTTGDLVGAKFGDSDTPLLVSVRSGAQISMPGMMETILNVGLTDATRDGLIRQTGNPWFVYDAQRRLIQMYADVVMEKAAGREPADGDGIRVQLEREMARMKEARGVTQETDLSADDLRHLVDIFKGKVREVLGEPFPDDPWKQLWGGISAVFASWNGKRAVAYRRIEGIPDDWGTAVTVQAMVFGNLGTDSATGVAFTRNPATGENAFYGEWLPQAQGEDVVAGIRTPNPLTEAARGSYAADLPSLEAAYPKLYRELDAVRARLEAYYRDMLDIEFTIQSGRLWLLQSRVGKRTGLAAVRVATDMEREGLITAEDAVKRVTPAQLDELLHPIVDPHAERTARALARGLPAGPGGATGRAVFSAAAAVEWTQRGETVVLVREDTNPEDVEGMRAAVAILTARGGMTSHAALVARGWGKCCVVGASALDIDAAERVLHAEGVTIREGDWLSLNGTGGLVYAGKLPLLDSEAGGGYLTEFLGFCDQFRRLGVRANADTPADAARARRFGAQGIGLFRTEHMFYGEGSDQPLFRLRKVIMAAGETERRAALDELFHDVKAAVKDTFKVMEGLPVTIRLLDPPLHEFIPHGEAQQARLAKALGMNLDELQRRAEEIRETNPMMGHRGVRLGITYPEITEMQVRAILEAAAELEREGVAAHPEIMVPVVSLASEFRHQAEILRRVADEVARRFGHPVKFELGTMIEVPRAALTAGEIARSAEFFSFGTNDLTQMTFGISRDDAAFLKTYQERGLLTSDPFATLDQDGVGQLIAIAIDRGRATRPKLKVGVCGEHGGDPASIHFCHTVGMDYVSCSPYRVPIARLAAAQASLAERKPERIPAGR